MPSDLTSGPVRALRGALVGCGGASVSVLGHAAAGGAVPAPAPLVLGLIMSTAVCWWLSNRRWTPARLVGALLIVQSGLHLGLGTSAPHGPTPLMLLAHAGATAIAVRLLLSGEDWVWQLLDALSLRVALGLQVASTPDLLRRTRPLHDVVIDGIPVLLRWRRGPPAAPAA
jgi:hypothetical protein